MEEEAVEYMEVDTEDTGIKEEGSLPSIAVVEGSEQLEEMDVSNSEIETIEAAKDNNGTWKLEAQGESQDNIFIIKHLYYINKY